MNDRMNDRIRSRAEQVPSVYCSDATVPTTAATSSTIIVGRTAATELVVPAT